MESATRFTRNINWNDIFLNPDTDDEGKKFLDALNSIIQASVPLKRHRSTSKSKPWLKRKLNRLFKKKKQKWNEYTNDKCLQKWANYTTARNRFANENNLNMKEKLLMWLKKTPKDITNICLQKIRARKMLLP